MSRIPYYYDPYDFSDTSTSEDDDHSYMQQDEPGGDGDIAGADFNETNQDIDMASASGSYSAASRSTVPTRVTLSAFTGETGSSISSYTREGSTRSSTPESVISMTESLRTRMYREEYGRGLNNYSEVYRLPADEEEWSRLEKQHLMNIDMIGAKYPPPMGPVLQSNIPGEKKVLDLGCGSGAWIRDVARDFPFCEVVGVDLVPIRESAPFAAVLTLKGMCSYTVSFSASTLPPNARNEVDDINFGLSHFYDGYDVVHCRLIAAGITDYRLLVDRIARVLRPGGMVELMEYDFHTYDRHGQRVPVSIEESRLGPPWWARFLGHVRAATTAQGGDTTAATHIRDWVTNCGAFENVSYHDFWPPVVPGDDERYDEIVYARMIDIMTSYLASAKPLLRGYGISEVEFEILEQNVLREIHQSNTAQFTRLQCVYATKRHDVLLADDV